jgi:hypothetical protein
MSDEQGPAEVDDPLDPADSAFVTGLLAGLPEARMPDDVAARLDAALADLPPVTGTAAATTVVPLAERRDRRAARRNARATRIAGLAAAFVVLAGVGAVTVGALKNSSGGSAGGAAVAGADRSSAAAVTHSGTTYTDASIQTSVPRLVSTGLPTVSPTPAYASSGSPTATASSPSFSSSPSTTEKAGGSSTPPSTASPSTSPPNTEFPGPQSTASAPAASQVPLSQLFTSDSTLQPCLQAVEDGLTQFVTPLAMDVGTYDGVPALVVVLPSTIDPEHAYDVFVVGATCGTDQEAHLLTYRKVDKP